MIQDSQALRQENLQLKRELSEAQETVRAIHEGKVDAFVVGRDETQKVLTLGNALEPYRILVDRMQQCAVTCDSNGTVLFANRQTSTLLGLEPSSLPGCAFRDFVAEADWPQVDAVTDNSIDAPSKGEVRLKRADGCLIPVYLNARRLAPDEGVGVCILMTDLSLQKQHEQLIVAENLARSMLEQAADAVVVCDTDGRIAFASPPAHELSVRNPLGKPFVEMFPLVAAKGNGLAADERIDIAKLDKPMRGVEVTPQREGSLQGSLLMSAAPVRDKEGVPLGSVVTLTDIGALRVAQLELQEADRQKDEFLAVLAHELRNPLAPIVTGLEVLRLADNAGEPASHALRMIRRQVDHLTRLVDDLLEVSRITLGKIVLRKEVLNFADVLSSALETTRSFIDTSHHSLEIDLPDEPIQVEADGVRLSQVIVNLLNNAAKYTPASGNILLKARADNGQLEIRVRDSGRGIPAESLDEVFNMFSQARRSNLRHDGLGIGLALVRRIVELHGGTVSVTSPGVGHGSEFTVRLPLGNTADAGERQQSSPDVPGPRSRRVLVVDDNQDSATSLGTLLGIMEYDVKVAFDGESALVELDRFKADTIFLDLGMPGIDGYEVARRIRERADAKDATLIALTGWGQEDDRRLTREAGFDYHLLKPVNVDTLKSVLEETQ